MKHKFKLSVNTLLAAVFLASLNSVPAHSSGGNETCVLEFVPRSWFFAGKKKLYRLSRNSQELADVESRKLTAAYSENSRQWTKTRYVGGYIFQIQEQKDSGDLDNYRYYQVQNADLQGFAVLETTAGATTARMIFLNGNNETLSVRIPYYDMRDFNDVLTEIVCIFSELKNE